MNESGFHVESVVDRYSSITALIAFLTEYEHFHPNSLNWVVEMLIRRHYGQKITVEPSEEIDSKVRSSSRDIKDFLMYRGSF